MKKSVCIMILLGMVVLTSNYTAMAANRAVLIGVGAYSSVTPLFGPPHDVAALKELLTRSWGFDPANITTLVDERATKANILKTLNDLSRSTSPDDFVFIYFSGHGTSAHDRDLRIDMGTFTGALVPVEFSVNSDVEDMKRRLIIGTRDLKPIFQKLDNNRELFVVFDCCYSGQSVRDLEIPLSQRKGRPKYLDLSSTLTREDADRSFGTPTAAEPAFPYHNLFFISAANKGEEAKDILIPDKIPGGTYGREPHGALTDALLKGLSGKAGTNGQGFITKEGLYQYVLREVKKNFRQTPQCLYDKSNPGVLSQPVFRSALNRPGSVQTKPDADLKINMVNVSAGLEATIAAVKKVRLVKDEYDLKLTQASTGYTLALLNGDMLSSHPSGAEEDVVKRIALQVELKKLIDLAYPTQDFDVSMNIIGRKSLLKEGEDVGIAFQTTADSYPLLINIDCSGNISVIYPGSKDEIRPWPKGKEYHQPNLGKVKAPFGTEYMKLFAFKDKPDGLAKLMGQSFTPSDDFFRILLDTVKDAKGGQAQSTLEVLTYSK
ncbi:MAG: caspase family protein [Deltaproteobacteria bacterium]|nr:caspase family protein [Deltaproteobacteria bacterium]